MCKVEKQQQKPRASDVRKIDAARAFIQGFVSIDHEPCTGDTDTCPEAECLECGARECPYGEPLHFHHDGCPACYVHEVGPDAATRYLFGEGPKFPKKDES
jgi:hypothetical protein